MAHESFKKANSAEIRERVLELEAAGRRLSAARAKKQRILLARRVSWQMFRALSKSEQELYCPEVATEQVKQRLEAAAKRAKDARAWVMLTCNGQQLGAESKCLLFSLVAFSPVEGTLPSTL